MTRTVGFYVSRQFLVSVGAVYGALMVIIFLIDTAELLRRAANRPEATFGVVLNLALLHLPDLGAEALPFAMLFGSMFALVRLTRSHELVVLRAAGISAWQFLTPALAVALLIGLLDIGVWNPIGASMLAAHQQGVERYLSGRPSILAVSSTGLWLRENDGKGGHMVVHATTVEPETMSLRGVTVFQYRGDDEFSGRVDAESAVLAPGKWQLTSAWIMSPTKAGERIEAVEIPTVLTLSDMRESLSTPDTVSFWQLPRFIAVLEATGLSSLGHRLQWHQLLARPFLFMAMILLAASVSLRFSRGGGTLPLLLGGIVAGFAFFLFASVVRTLGLGERLPIAFAAWAPAGVTLMIGLAMLMHLEDG